MISVRVQRSGIAKFPRALNFVVVPARFINRPVSSQAAWRHFGPIQNIQGECLAHGHVKAGSFANAIAGETFSFHSCQGDLPQKLIPNILDTLFCTFLMENH